MKTILLQSHHPPPRPEWIELCLQSAARWASAAGVARRFIHDELFQDLAPAFLAATSENLLPRTDIGRLHWIDRLHRDGWDRVIWLDADVLVFDPTLRFDGDAIAREAWISSGPTAAARVLRKVNNCAMCFDAGSPNFDRYFAAARDAALRFTAGASRMALGPDLLSRLHVERPFPLHSDVAMFSPRTIDPLAASDWNPLRLHNAIWKGRPKAANLCASFGADPARMLDVAERLVRTPQPGGDGSPYEELRAWKGAPQIW